MRELGEERGQRVAHHRNHTRRAAFEQVGGNAVVAAEHLEAFGSIFDDFLPLCHVARCLFHRHHVGAVLSDAQGGGRREVHARASRHVIEHYGQLRAVGHGLEMPVKAFRRRLVVVGAHNQYAVHEPFALNVAEAVDNVSGAVAARSEEQGHAPGIGLMYVGNDITLFFGGEAGRFGRCAEHAKKVCAAFNLFIHELAQGFIIGRAIGLERRNDGHSKPFENIFANHTNDYICLNLPANLRISYMTGTFSHHFMLG